jgi:hypothetical protein
MTKLERRSRWAIAIAFGVIVALVAAPPGTFRAFVAPPVVRESLTLDMPCKTVVDQLPVGEYLAFGPKAFSEPASVVESAVREWPPRTVEPEPQFISGEPLGFEISYGQRWFDCASRGGRSICLVAPHSSLMFTPGDTIHYSAIQHRDAGQFACACVSWRDAGGGCAVQLEPVPFIAWRTVPPNAMNLAHGQTSGRLPFVAFAPEHWMDALCHELARVGGAQTSACVKSVTPNDTIFARWAF